MTSLTIAGLAEAGQHVVVKLDTWEVHAPVAMIPIFEPLEFYRAGNRLMGHRIDLGGRINGNFKVRRASFFLGQNKLSPAAVVRGPGIPVRS